MGRPVRNRIVAGTAIAALALSFIGHFEGRRLKAYRDIVGVWTICDGETKGVKPGDVATPEECDAKFLPRLQEFERGVVSCNEYPMSDTTLVSQVSLAYNVGVRTYCRSSVVRLFNSNHPERACKAMLAYDHAGGRPVRGLTIRRKSESELCLKEI